MGNKSNKKAGGTANGHLSRRQFLGRGAMALGAAVTGAGLLGAGQAGFVRAEETLKEIKEMPHVNVSIWPGRSEKTKQELADAIVQDVVNIIGCSENSVSVAIEEVDPSEWKEKIYDPQVSGSTHLYKKPGYSM